ncbi:hypothetical protein LZ009_12440 [Ramlibacter sp. XY19]|uniref:hypothetical protein n=1 Tax=Ramlibacter paludis TaxID=2908000 RepID=UPI0023DBD807|nr:hypothetical protein [Ramlibacter paludis]MCG2593587.1 hypothetical protein [Ramlibacter paludis]
MRSRWSALLAAAVLVGCGGGADGEAADPAAEARGSWAGSTGSNRSIAGLVLADGSYAVFYSSPGYPTVLGGAVLGSGTASGGALASAGALHLNLEGLGVLAASVTGTIVPRETFAGTILSTGIPPVTFSSTYDAGFAQPARLATIVGRYTGLLGSASGKLAAAWTVDTSGQFSLSTSGCTATGQLLPRADGNVFDAAIVFGAAPCPLAGQSVRGLAVLRGADGRFFLAAPNGSRSDAALLSGTRS